MLISRVFDEQSPWMLFTTHYVSRQASNCPIIPEIKKIYSLLQNTNRSSVSIPPIISATYGKRIIINGMCTTPTKIIPETIIEVVDYDPAKKLLLLIGSCTPWSETPVHWLIHQARPDIIAIIRLRYNVLAKKASKIYPTTEIEHSHDSLEQAKQLLLLLRENKIIVIKEFAIILTGKRLEELGKKGKEIIEELL